MISLAPARWPNGTWHRYYYCRNHDPLRAGGEQHRCPECNIRADALDAFVFDHIRAAITHPEQLLAGKQAVTLRTPILGGKAKEEVGKVTGDKSTENEGKGDQTKSNLKDPASRSRTRSKSKQDAPAFDWRRAWFNRLSPATWGRWRADVPCRLSPAGTRHRRAHKDQAVPSHMANFEKLAAHQNPQITYEIRRPDDQ